ncbi:hypothetical protein E2542_SST11198 [Spatholobus suberectus]|nr:hypothetical protein E2542_SST11198 [Spatholobus suberectus]
MMRCFLPCFGTCKRRTQLRSADAATPIEGTQTHVGEEGAVEPLARQKTLVEELIDCIAESKIKNEEQSNNSVETKEEPSREEEAPQIDEKKKDDHEEDDEINKRSHQEESSESLFSLSICSRKQVSDAEAAEIEVNSPMQLVCKREVTEAFGSSSSVQLQHVSSVPSPLEILSLGKPSEENTKHHEQQPSFVAIKKGEESSANELIKKLDENEGEKRKANHPVPQYRYRDCPDEGYDDVNLDESDLDATLEDDNPRPPNEKTEGEEGADVKRTWVQEESSESLFSLSTDSRIRISSAEEAENEVNSLMPARATNRITQEETRERIPDVSSVLNPIENLTQGRGLKATVLQPLTNDKENINLVVQDVNIPISPEPSLKLSNRKARQRFSDKKKEIGVDTSLSSWLVESETTPISVNSTTSVGEPRTPKGGSGSPLSHEDRPILGALTVEDIRMFYISTSSRMSRSRSPDETPIIGTVGSYWSHTGQSMDSEFNRSGKDLKRSSKAVQTRLERAFEASVSEV